MNLRLPCWKYYRLVYLSRVVVRIAERGATKASVTRNAQPPLDYIFSKSVRMKAGFIYIIQSLKVTHELRTRKWTDHRRISWVWSLWPSNKNQPWRVPRRRWSNLPIDLDGLYQSGCKDVAAFAVCAIHRSYWIISKDFVTFRQPPQCFIPPRRRHYECLIPHSSNSNK